MFFRAVDLCAIFLLKKSLLLVTSFLGIVRVKVVIVVAFVVISVGKLQ